MLGTSLWYVWEWMATGALAAVFILPTWQRSHYSLAFELGWCKRPRRYAKHSTTRFIRKGCLSWECYPESQRNSNKFCRESTSSWAEGVSLFLILCGCGWLLFCRLTMLYLWQDTHKGHLMHPSSHAQLSSLGCSSQESLAHVVKSICLSCQADASPLYDPGFL